MISTTTLRRSIKKWIFGSCPGLAGSFPYFGTKVYFPKNSLIFKMACEQGFYEVDNMQLVTSLVKENSVYFDIGANIGLMSIPILHCCDSSKVVSFEPSPGTLQFLTRTATESKFEHRWRVIGKAAGNEIGTLDFFTAPVDMGAFDGFQNTKRVDTNHKITVSVTTLDAEWEEMGRPQVSVIKIDVEGAEIETLKGGITCIQHENPYILLEWNATNLKAYDCPSDSLISFAKQIEYQIYSLPLLLPVYDSTTLKVQMLKTESFLLVPIDKTSLLRS